ncbi:hypothetical protein [Xanthobacter sediminis]
MKVQVKKFNVNQEIKNSGMQLDIYSPDGEERLGDLTITKTKLIWCAGKIHKKNGVEVTWNDFIEWMES